MPREFIGIGVLAVLGALLFVLVRSPPTLRAPAVDDEPIVVPVRPVPPPPPPPPHVEPPAVVLPAAPTIDEALPSVPGETSGGGHGRSSGGTRRTEDFSIRSTSSVVELAAFYEREMTLRGLAVHRWESPGVVVIEGEGPLRTEVAELRARDDASAPASGASAADTDVVTRSITWRVADTRSSSRTTVVDLGTDVRWPLPRTAACNGSGSSTSGARTSRNLSCTVARNVDAASFYERQWIADGLDVRRIALRDGAAMREVIVGRKGARRASAVLILKDDATHATLDLDLDDVKPAGRAAR